MASNRIIGDTQNKALAKRVAVAVDRLLDSREEIARVLRDLNSSSNGNDWTALAGELGLQAIGTYSAAQQAQDLVFLFNCANDVLNGTIYVDSGSVSTKARLDELYRVDQG